MEISFAFGGDAGRVRVDCVPNTDPPAVGKTEHERGMPTCTASVEFGAKGYRALLGWVQLVRDPSSSGRFVIDPFDLFADSTAPFAWYGFRPTLFDAPSRRYSGAVEWEAHSFLTVGPWDVDRRLVVPLVGFSWGYLQDGEELQLSPVRLVGPEKWDGHRPYMIERYPDWKFGPGLTLGEQVAGF